MGRLASAVEVSEATFHDFAVRHPLVRVYREARSTRTLRQSDVATARQQAALREVFGLAHVMAVPLSVTPRGLSVVTLMKDGADFGEAALAEMRGLERTFSGFHVVASAAPGGGHPFDLEPGTTLTPREVAVLDLMS